MTALFDIHCHGAVGASFGTDQNAAHRIIESHRAAGVERVVASLVTAPPDQLVRQVESLAPLVREGHLAGIHLEGPFLAEARCGAHDPTLLIEPDPEVVRAVVEAAGDVDRAIVQWTIAPELPGWWSAAQVMIDHGIQPALGHTDADSTTMRRAIDAITDRSGRPALVTHLFNGMRPMHHRAGGAAVGALVSAARGDAIVELIADGIHVDADVLAMVFESVGPDAVALVSDAMAATGLGDGCYQLGALRVDVSDGVARLEGGGSLAGSTTNLARCVDYVVHSAGVAEADAVHSATVTPARALGLS